jgi:hypothetical protein
MSKQPSHYTSSRSHEGHRPGSKTVDPKRKANHDANQNGDQGPPSLPHLDLTVPYLFLTLSSAMSSSDATATFDRYDDEFASLVQQIETSLNNEPPSPYTHNLLVQCDDLIKQMAVEARSNTADNVNLKRTLLDKVRLCKSKYQALQAQSDRQNLLVHNNKTNNEFDRLRRNEDMLANQSDTLERARRTMEETEAVALEITDELGQNREKLMSAHGRIREVGGLTGRARRVLTSMNQRAMQQKMIMYAVGLALFVGFVALLYGLWG